MIFKKQKVYREITADQDKNMSVKASTGSSWYLHCLADLVTEGKLTELEFKKIFDSEMDYS
jgi:hypothetical protein